MLEIKMKRLFRFNVLQISINPHIVVYVSMNKSYLDIIKNREIGKVSAIFFMGDWAGKKFLAKISIRES